MDWITINHDRLIKLTFTKFIVEFKATYLPKYWEDIMCIELLQLNQNTSSFWDFSVAVQYNNSLLIGTDSYMSNEQLHHCIESRMNPKLALHVCLEKGDKYKTLPSWLTKIKCIDDLMRAECVDFDALAKATHKST
jgi:hypothetical protein